MSNIKESLNLMTARRLAEEYTLGNIDLKNSRQRGMCWNLEQKSRLINTLCEKYPVPPLYLVESEDEGIFAIDGKQRIDAISSYINGKYALSKNTPSIELKSGEEYELSNKTFLDLQDDVKDMIKEYEIKIINITNATDDDLDSIFSRLNGGSAMDELIKTLNSAKSKEQINIVSDHELYTNVNNLNFEKYDHKNLTVKSWIMLNDPNPAFAWTYVKKILETTDITDDSIMDLWACLNRMLDIHVYIDENINDPKIKKNMLDNLGKPTHFSSLMPIIRKSIQDNIDTSLFADWVTKFYPGTKVASVNEEYNNAARTNRRENIRLRQEILLGNYKATFNTDRATA